MASAVKSLYNDSVSDSSGDDFEIEMEMESPSREEREIEAEDYPFKVLSAEEIVQHMLDCIRDVNTVVEIPATVTRILLHYFQWDKEKLIEQFFDGDRDKLYADAKVVNPFRKPVVKRRQSRRHKTSPAKTDECQICLTAISSHLMTGLDCNHKFCTQCWGMYLETKIMEEGIGQSIPCAAHACDILVDDASVMRLVEDTKVKLKYQLLITNSFVECNRLMKWCPAPDCSYAIRVQYVDARPVTCGCRHMFCFACGENWHDPIACHLLKRWLAEPSDEFESSFWILTNTKECPKCHVKIEKNGGCNHMSCKNSNCKTQFCWLCLGDWNAHSSSGYYCNTFNVEERIARDKEALERFKFYRNRYMSHAESRKLEHVLYTSIKEKMEVMMDFNMSYVEVLFLDKAVDILCQCRQAVTYSYVFAFYLRQNNQTLIFEDNQRDLERATEELSKYLEQEITPENLGDIKQNVKDKSQYCDRRRKVLLEHVQEGHDKAWWEYVENI